MRFIATFTTTVVLVGAIACFVFVTSNVPDASDNYIAEVSSAF